MPKGAEAFYGDTQNYELTDNAKARRSKEEEAEYWYEESIQYGWKDFCEEVQYHNRLFKLKERLDDLFGKPEDYNSIEIPSIYHLQIGRTFYRARLFDCGITHSPVDERPALELGAPPASKASAGRMNVELIPAFYAALSKNTSIAEIRPSVGDLVAVGVFEVVSVVVRPGPRRILI